MTRRQLREATFLLLFRKEFHSREEMKDQVNFYYDSKPDIPPEDRKYIEDRLDSLMDALGRLDDKISSICEGWRLSRLGKVELAILRLAVFEIEMDPDIPVGVAINEAVELAKIYGGEDASRFVNGVLAKLGTVRRST